jgi:hypothetical protein
MAMSCPLRRWLLHLSPLDIQREIPDEVRQQSSSVRQENGTRPQMETSCQQDISRCVERYGD